ncbi:MAG: NTP transferase domain-containing protein [Melioribacteraceae bacterium]|nr:NTP transferase domain-containing protein [Melioribacteraceae bacterium]MCF8263584.1 NTP transferase domain-containing protein [Melioribacteraceae bacterium]MCF8412423.1 NTP transferase domain-containing protein [Melioribacteraceae bacterium]MCF8430824.1 NTP transferase domain-containing protein [Melioribacteraceae bacterium]
MRAIIPVAGFGTRLKPHTHSLPKVLVNVGGKPILGHILDKLLSEDIFKATFVVGHLGDKIREYVKTTYPSLQADYIEQTEMLGLGHAIYTAIPTFDDDDIFIILGDTVFDVDLSKVLKEKKNALGVKEIEDPRRFGVAVVENGKITKLVEKPEKPVSHLALVGLYYISKKQSLIDSLNELVENNIKTRGEFQLTDALQLMIEKGDDIYTFPVEGWYDCGKPETLLSTNQFLLSQYKTVYKLDNVIINHPVYISPSAKISNSVIGPNATISEDCVIEDSNIRNSIISQGAKVIMSMLENSIIGNNAFVRGNFKRLNAGDSSEIEFY